MLIKILGYNLLMFLICRFYKSLKKSCRSKEIYTEIASDLLVYIPLLWFVVDRLIDLGLKL